MDKCMVLPQITATNRPLSSPCMKLLGNHYPSQTNIIGTIMFGGTKTKIHTRRQIKYIPIFAELETDVVLKIEPDQSYERKPRFLCLHGFRTSGEIFKKQIDVNWPTSISKKLDLVYIDAPFPCQGRSLVEKFYDPPYYEWFQFIYHKDYIEYPNIEKSLAYIENCMLEYGPFDGLLGFSQGAGLAALLSGLQAKGLALKKVPKIKLLILIGAGTPKNRILFEKAFSSKVQTPSIHFIGEKDNYVKQESIELVELFVDPVVVYHSKGHTVPRLVADEKNSNIMEKILERMQRELMKENYNNLIA